jgi:hypothetical protein
MNSCNGFLRKFTESTTQLYMTIPEAEALSRELAEHIRPAVLSDLRERRVVVVGIANGGLMPAKIVSDVLVAPMSSVRIRRVGSRYKRALGSIGPLVRSGLGTCGAGLKVRSVSDH